MARIPNRGDQQATPIDSSFVGKGYNPSRFCHLQRITNRHRHSGDAGRAASRNCRGCSWDWPSQPPSPRSWRHC